MLPGGPGDVRPEPGDRPAFRSVLVNALRGRCPWLSGRAARSPRARTYNGQRRPREPGLAVFAQVRGHMEVQGG